MARVIGEWQAAMRTEVGTVRKRTIFSESARVDLTAVDVVLQDEPRKRGQGDRADGDAEKPEWQVHDPEREVSQLTLPWA